jgi:argininosuccinate lyase
MPFRQAHHAAGRAVKQAESRGVPLSELTLEEFHAIDPAIDDRVFSVLTVEASVASRLSEGGAAPVRVREAAAAARSRFL